jgi:hypothetical protein
MATNCTRCGSEIDSHSVLCAECTASTGTEIASPASDAAPIPSADLARTATVPPPAFLVDTELKGIGGWLVLTVTALALGPLFALHGIYKTLHVLYGSGFQATLAARPGLAVLILFEASTNAVFLFALIGLNVLFYKTRRSFPRWMITFLIAAFFITLTDHLFAMYFHPAARWTAVFQRLVAALIWVPYFLQSRRVQQTFVD